MCLPCVPVSGGSPWSHCCPRKVPLFSLYRYVCQSVKGVPVQILQSPSVQLLPVCFCGQEETTLGSHGSAAIAHHVSSSHHVHCQSPPYLQRYWILDVHSSNTYINSKLPSPPNRVKSFRPFEAILNSVCGDAAIRLSDSGSAARSQESARKAKDWVEMNSNPLYQSPSQAGTPGAPGPVDYIAAIRPPSPERPHQASPKARHGPKWMSEDCNFHAYLFAINLWCLGMAENPSMASS